MGSFLPDYNDPIVSIFLLLGIIFAVSVISYGYSIWKQEQKQKELLNFLKSFDSNECMLDTQNMHFDDSMQKPLFLLARSYQRSGEYSKSINLYLYLLKHTKDSSILSHLASAYYKAGFIKRAVDIYKEILHNTPRDIAILYKLELCYEHLRDYTKAQEVLNILEVLNEDVTKYTEHLDLQLILTGDYNKEQKFAKITAKLEDSRHRWVLLRELFKLEPLNAWEYFRGEEFKKVVDIAWKLDIEQLNFDIISKYSTLSKLYSIKGLLQSSFSQKETIFAIDLIAAAKEGGFNSGDLSFKYSCTKCKNSFPLMAYRCPNCQSVYSFNVKVLVEQKREERGYSLQ
jgi:tetratricopeptide (TPR) repeat protein